MDSSSNQDAPVVSSVMSSLVSANPNSYEDPLFISNNENVGVSLVTQRLNGFENFITWKISMEMALAGKMKLSFVRGKIPKPEGDPLQ